MRLEKRGPSVLGSSGEWLLRCCTARTRKPATNGRLASGRRRTRLRRRRAWFFRKADFLEISQLFRAPFVAVGRQTVSDSMGSNQVPVLKHALPDLPVTSRRPEPKSVRTALVFIATCSRLFRRLSACNASDANGCVSPVISDGQWLMRGGYAGHPPAHARVASVRDAGLAICTSAHPRPKPDPYCFARKLRRWDWMMLWKHAALRRSFAGGVDQR